MRSNQMGRSAPHRATPRHTAPRPGPGVRLAIHPFGLSLFVLHAFTVDSTANVKETEFAMQAIFRPLCAAMLLSAAAVSHAATWTQPAISGGDSFAVTYKNKTTNLTVSPGGLSTGDVRYYDGNLTPQSPDAILGYVATQFSVAPATLSLAAYCNSDGTNCSGASVSGPASGIYSFNTTSAFDYLAVHLGGGELLFHWAIPTSSFTITGLTGGALSDYRAYVSSVPLPGAAWLFLSALGLGGAARRMRKPSGAEAAAAA